MAEGGALGTTTPGSGLKTTVPANASWTGPRVRTCTPCSLAAGSLGGGGAAAGQMAMFQPTAMSATSAKTRRALRIWRGGALDLYEY